MNCNKRQRGPRDDERKNREENHLKNMTCSEARELYILSIGKRSVNERVRDELEKAMWGLPCGSNGKSICLQCRRPRFDTLEKGMGTHSSILAWRIPWTEDPGKLQPMGSQRVSTE